MLLSAGYDIRQVRSRSPRFRAASQMATETKPTTVTELSGIRMAATRG